MSDFSIRDYSPSDLPQMAELWRRCFGDSLELIESFLHSLPDMGGAIVAEAEGGIVGAAYALTGMELLRGGEEKPPICGYIYAVAVDKDFRRRGIGAALTLSAADLAHRREADIICVEPASEALFAWYEKLLGVKCVLRRSEKEFSCSAQEPTMTLSSTEYMLWRENMLKNRPHIHHSNHSLEAQRKMLAECNGGFYACASGIAAGCVVDDKAVISELLCMDASEEERIAASVGAAMKTERVLLRTADEKGLPYMAADRAFPKNCVWNLSFD